MARMYSRDGQQFSLLVLIGQLDLDDDQLDQLADLEPGEEATLDTGVRIRREE